MIFPATALNGWSFELAGQMAAPGFDLELNLHRSQSQNGSFRMRMEAWVEVGIEFLVDSEGRLMEAIPGCKPGLRAGFLWPVRKQRKPARTPACRQDA